MKLPLKEYWFWAALASLGYLFSMYGVLIGLNQSWAGLLLPLIFAPLAFPGMETSDRYKGFFFAAIFAYFVLLTILVRNSYYPDSAISIINLFFIFLFTIPAFLIRTPMYLLLQGANIDTVLTLSGCMFFGILVVLVKRAPLWQQAVQRVVISFFLISMCITMLECITLGESILELSSVPDAVENTVKKYYKVAILNF